jgi:hypothetical protein
VILTAAATPIVSMIGTFSHSLPGFLAQVQASLPQTSLPQAADYMRILPELVLSIFGMLIMVVDPLLDRSAPLR